MVVVLQVCLLFVAILNIILHGVISCSPDLGLEVDINQFRFLRRPLAVGVPVVYHLTTASITNLDCGVRQRTFRRPFDHIASSFLYRKRLGAADIVVAVDALLNGVIENLAIGNGATVCRSSVSGGDSGRKLHGE